ncbi:hypothetical protein HYPSUDRAFT_65632 [Hypholoma sublateritium FD-334 SS-4]|uniref:F-box domain-containing protein n=1 Tax=Hypholoma sublateritium (strain FD-334 SS-4) TaxID=945553 RepID=A0A0D2P6W3_HYPSF|nr:hypothetical protein HYPSUDRAFT_65632 [Hypholoma sublateritium FD-334 SS-4]
MPIQIQSLPVELLEFVFEYIASAPSSTTSSPVKGSGVAPYRALFPFNVAATCHAWLSVLMHHGKYWDRIIIDVAEDLTPFLDALEVHKLRMASMTLHVVVFSSAGGAPYDIACEASNNALELSRVRKVHKALESFLEQCESITFDLVYQSSLPSAIGLLSNTMPSLRRLSLTCSVHDLDDSENAIAVPARAFNLQQDQQRVPQLRELTVTGVGFMELCQYPIWKYMH